MIIEANFLRSEIRAASKTDRTDPEWPICPSRLFSALVAALHSIPEQTTTFWESRAAISWLETLEPPEVHAPPEDGIMRPLTYVPPNDVSIVKPAKARPMEACLPDSPRRKKPREHPGTSVPIPLTRYVWHVLPEQLAEHRIGLQHVLSRVSYLGRSVNLVLMRLLEIEPETLPDADALERWLPSLKGTRRMRVIGPGRLKHLEQLYLAKKPVDHGPTSLYLRAGDELPLDAASGPWSPMWTVFSLAGCLATSNDTEFVAKSIRRMLVSRAVELGMSDGRDSHVDAFISGHEADGAPSRIERLAVVPLANIMNEYADARIMGFAIAMPAAATADQWSLLSTLFFGPDGETPLERLTIGKQELPVSPVHRPGTQGLSPSRYVASAYAWTTATPMLLSRRPDKHSDRIPFEVLIERIRLQVKQDCAASGMPDPELIEVSNVSPLDGVAHARSFGQHRSGGVRWSTHVTLHFGRVVRGPLLIGAGRYNGLGLLVPVKSPIAIGNG